MNLKRSLAPRLLGAAAIVLALGLSACAGEATPAADAPTTTTAVPMTPTADPNAPFGPGCASLPASGPGSPAEMTDQPVATAAAQNPALSTLVSAVTEAGL